MPPLLLREQNDDVTGGTPSPRNTVAALSVVAVGPATSREGEMEFRTADDFTRDELLGTGSFCDVLRCTDRVSGKRYAMKLVPKRRSEVDQACIMEAHCLRRLERSPAIVSMLWDIDSPQQWVAILELCPGGELWAHIRQCGCIAEGESAWYAGQMVEALSAVHAAGIVHRDLKCENFLIAETRKLKLIDFGTARDTNHPEVAPMLLGPQYEHHVGTPNFMSPEAINGKANDRRSDLWSLGCCVYQLITGAPPFSAPTPFLVMSKAQAGKLWMPSKGLSPEERDFIWQLTQVEPEKRFGAQSGQTRRVLRHAFLRVPPSNPPADDTLLAVVLRKVGRTAADEAAAVAAVEAAAAAGEEGLEFEGAEDGQGPLGLLGGTPLGAPKIGVALAKLLEELPSLQATAVASAEATGGSTDASASVGGGGGGGSSSSAAAPVAADVAAEQGASTSAGACERSPSTGARGASLPGGTCAAAPLAPLGASEDPAAEAQAVVELLGRVRALGAEASSSPQDFIRRLAEGCVDASPEAAALPLFVRSTIQRFAEMADQHCIEAREQFPFLQCGDDNDSSGSEFSAKDENGGRAADAAEVADEDVDAGAAEELDIADESNQYGKAVGRRKKSGSERTPSDAEISTVDEHSNGDNADVAIASEAAGPSSTVHPRSGACVPGAVEGESSAAVEAARRGGDEEEGAAGATPKGGDAAAAVELDAAATHPMGMQKNYPRRRRCCPLRK